MPRKSKHEHKQMPIIDDGEVIFSVDEKLQSLIQFYWDKGFHTWNSCQDNVRDMCWIEYDLEDWIFINEVAFRTEPRDLYEFIDEECEVLLLRHDDGQPDEKGEYWIEGENLDWSASVRFHKELLADFEALIRATLTDLNPEEEGAAKT